MLTITHHPIDWRDHRSPLFLFALIPSKSQTTLFQLVPSMSQVTLGRGVVLALCTAARSKPTDKTSEDALRKLAEIVQSQALPSTISASRRAYTELRAHCEFEAKKAEITFERKLNKMQEVLRQAKRRIQHCLLEDATGKYDQSSTKYSQGGCFSIMDRAVEDVDTIAKRDR